MDGYFFAYVGNPSGWTHFVLNYIGPNNGQGIRFYFDGAEVASDIIKWLKSKSAGDGRVVIGRQYIDVDDKYAGIDVDELLFFNETLSVQQMMVLKDMV